MTTPLARALLAEIRAGGPISVARFMAAALYDPRHGYYAVRPALGAQGDFITAPEISQMVGELIGLWAVHEWRAMGAPAPFTLLELGPGRGALMADAWRAARLAPEFQRAARICLVEASRPLRALQAEALGAVGAEPCWLDRLEDAPTGPLLAIGNEFLDCFPARQFVAVEGGWAERCVGADPASGDRLAFGLAPCPPPPGAPGSAPPGYVHEVQEGLGPWVSGLAARLRAAPGRALLIDYGSAGGEGADTLQAVRRHQKVEPLAAPGECDLTIHVDFAALAALGREAGLSVSGPIEMGRFLRGLGLDHRAAALAQAHPARAERIWREHRRLTAETEMGVLFKVLCLSSRPLPPPAGL